MAPDRRHPQPRQAPQPLDRRRYRVNPASRGETPAASRPPLKRFPDGLGRMQVGSPAPPARSAPLLARDGGALRIRRRCHPGLARRFRFRGTGRLRSARLQVTDPSSGTRDALSTWAPRSVPNGKSPGILPTASGAVIPWLCATRGIQQAAGWSGLLQPASQLLPSVVVITWWIGVVGRGVVSDRLPFGLLRGMRLWE